jgi:2-oxoglutarate dehydrogenase E1 component
MVDLNSAYEAELYFKYLQNPEAVSEEWRQYFQSKYGTQLDHSPDAPSLLPTSDKVKQLTLKELKTSEDDELIPIPSLQERIADNMEISLGVPTATSVRTIPVKALDENRRLINNYLEKLRRGKVSFTHLITWAIIRALRKFPHFNDAFVRIDGRSHRLRRKSINLGFAVDLTRKDGSRMLLVPNLKDVERMHFDEFVQKYDDLIVRARTGKLSVDELQNTTISITNPGMIGTTMSNPRLMQGQSLILAIGSIDYPTEYKAVRPEALTTLAISKVVTITNTYDHRIIQGAESAEFLSYIQELLLGGEQFYDSIFAVLHIPFEPIRWESDTMPINQFGRIDEQELIEKSAHVELMINAYRVRGHLLASTNPLGHTSFYYPELNPSYYGFTIWDLDRIFHAEDLWEKNNLPLRDIIERLRDTYCGSIGYEFMHIQDAEKKDWIKRRLELHNDVGFTNDERIAFLKKLIEAEEFENFLHTKYVGHKRFSLEGGESAIVLVDKIFQLAAKSKLLSIVVGMAHRGRLNLLVNEIGKPIEDILQEFEGDVDPNSFMGSGDVKYHLGAEGVYTSPNGEKIDVILSPNPSHLELVDPVVEGMARALANNFGDKTHSKVLPILIHGDAAFAGEGIVAETLNFSQLHGFRTGGTIHIVINNQIGFTTPSTESRSTFYATDIAKMIQVPILHVIGNDPEAVAQAGIFAFEYRQQFQSDVIIDLLCYRKYGHNEADEPTYTQPLLYKKIKSMLPISEIYRRILIQQGIIREETAIEFERQYQEHLQNAFVNLKSQNIAANHKKPVEFNPFAKFATSISRNDFNRIAKALTTIPNNFHLNPKLNNLIKRRQQIFDDPNGKIDWALAESLAFGSILLDGRDIRFSGQDSRRGTFSQRHSVYIDFETEEEYVPLNHISEKQGKLRIFDSPLSEISILGFEYGYSLLAKNSLVFWEAQFGDFANEAQPIFDQFVASGEKKWNQQTNLTVLLPHGYDGQGPEHSSARLERFLQLCAENNMFVANLTTPSNYFHILRRQAFVRKPLIIMTPKSMLRHPLALSPITELFNGGFSEIYDDASVESPEQIKKIILLSGKVYWELLDAINKQQTPRRDFAIVRIEQLYPLDETRLSEIFSRYPNARKIVWFQEEPQNMGAWGFLFERLINLVPGKAKLHYIGREPSASTATGSLTQHQKEQTELLQKVISF